MKSIAQLINDMYVLIVPDLVDRYVWGSGSIHELAMWRVVSNETELVQEVGSIDASRRGCKEIKFNQLALVL